MDLSVAAQLGALNDYAKENNYVIARQYVDKAKRGRIANSPQFRKMIEEGSEPNAPFQVILIWKFSRFTPNREHAVAFKSMLRRKGIQVVSITERADDTPAGRLLEAIIESINEIYRENLGQEVTWAMRDAASRGFFLGSRAPFGYKRVKVMDGAKERSTLEVDPSTAPVVKEIFQSSLKSNSLSKICKELNDRGITNRGKRWHRSSLTYLLKNEAYTGAALWGRTVKGKKADDPVRAEGAWPALISREMFDAVQKGMRHRAPKVPIVQRPGRVESTYLLSGLLKCGACGSPYIGQKAKGDRSAYYICETLYRDGAGTCGAQFLNAPRVEGFVVEKIRERVLIEETIVELVTLLAEGVDAVARKLAERVKEVEGELADVRRRLGRLYEALENSDLTFGELSPRILPLRHREEQMDAAREDAVLQLEQRRIELPTTEEMRAYVADLLEFLKEGSIPERKALIRNFVKDIKVKRGEATLTYTLPMPKGGVSQELALRESLVPSPLPSPTTRSSHQGSFFLFPERQSV